MAKPGLTDSLEILKTFTDVLYLANNDHMPREIERLLKQRKLSFTVFSIDDLFQIRDRVDLIGTVLFETTSLDISQQQKLAKAIEFLEMQDIGVILLNRGADLHAEDFDLDELWMRISVNLAYRKRSSGMIVKPARPVAQEQSAQNNNRLAQQLSMTGALVDNLTEQLRLAGFVQRDFLPKQLPNSPEVRWAATFLPAEWVSGDIYDIARIDEQHIGFYVADAVGHSMPAALLTMFLKQALVMRETIGNNYSIFSPAEIMQNLNMRMTAQKLSGYQFATCCYCLLNTKTLQMTYARAGHPYPILLRPGEEPRQLEISGSLLGIFENADYTQQTIQLRSRDKILLYSDGAEPFMGKLVSETGFEFSEAFRSLKEMPVVDMMDGFNVLAQNRINDIEEFDDITAVGLEVL